MKADLTSDKESSVLGPEARRVAAILCAER